MVASLFLMSMAAFPLADCVPARWDSADVATLRWLEGTPINCLLLEPPHWQPELMKQARAGGRRLLGVVRTPEEAERAGKAGFDGLVIDSDMEAPATALPVIRLSSRGGIDFDAPPPLLATRQGLWPGVRVEKDGHAVSLPTGAPWIETNTGFLRFVRAVLPEATPVWVAVRPPEGDALRGRNYVVALADAAMNGARWVLALDRGFAQGLFSGDARFAAEWAHLVKRLAFLESVRQYGLWRDRSSLALVQDPETGALFSGGFIDMLAARHIAAEITPPARVAQTSKPATEVLLHVNPVAPDSPERRLQLDLARRGITVYNAPLAWNPGRPKGDTITVDEKDVKGLADAWREINNMLGRRNFGLRVFGAPSMLSNYKISADGRTRAVHLLNFSDYPVENISLHLTGAAKTARVLTPDGTRAAQLYPAEEGVEIEIDRVEDFAIVIIE